MARPTDELIQERKEFINTIYECAKKPSLFSKVFLNHELFDYNAKYVDCKDDFIVYRSGRQVGKTMSTAVKAIHYAFFAPTMSDVIKNECVVVIAAPTQNQANIMFSRVRSLIVDSEFLKEYVVRDTQSEMWVRFLDGKGISKIITRATGETGITLRGYSPNVIIADECAYIKTSILRAFMPSGLATQARVWLTSTPAVKSGFFYEACQNSKPRKAGGFWTEFHIKSTQNPLVQQRPEFLEMIRELTQEEYTMEVEGEFLDIGDALIPYSLLLEAISDKKPRGNVRYVMGADIARSGKDELVFLIMAIDENDECFVVETYAESQSNLVEVVGKMREYCRKYNIETIYVDETGLGAGVVDMARAAELPVRGVVFSLQKKAEMYGDLRVLFENHRVKINSLGKLIYQLSYLKREYTEGNNIMKVTSDSKDDYPSALVLACQAVSPGDRWHLIETGKDLQRSLFG